MTMIPYRYTDDIYGGLSSDPELVRIYLTGLQGGDLSDEDERQFAFQILTIMRLFAFSIMLQFCHTDAAGPRNIG